MTYDYLPKQFKWKKVREKEEVNFYKVPANTIPIPPMV